MGAGEKPTVAGCDTAHVQLLPAPVLMKLKDVFMHMTSLQAHSMCHLVPCLACTSSHSTVVPARRTDVHILCSTVQD
jgi:hypothetical protein